MKEKKSSFCEKKNRDNPAIIKAQKAPFFIQNKDPHLHSPFYLLGLFKISVQFNVNNVFIKQMAYLIEDLRNVYIA